jgi:hypothetical protein
MSVSAFVHLESSTATKCEIELVDNKYFTLDIRTSDNDLGLTLANHTDDVCFFLRADQLAELFYALRTADEKYLDPCSACEGSGRVSNPADPEEPAHKVPCEPCHGSGAVLKTPEEAVIGTMDNPKRGG